MSTTLGDATAFTSYTETGPVLTVKNLVLNYKIERRGTIKGGTLHAVDDVSFDLGTKETIGVVGETGCGKTSLGRAIMQMPRPTSGEVFVAGSQIVGLHGQDLRSARRRMQMVFQDPYSSLDPKWHIVDLVAEPLTIYGIGDRETRKRRSQELLDLVGLDPVLVGPRRPREVSGGQCQRVAIARALALQPEILILDESVSSLDVSVQAQVINLLEDLRDEFDLSYLFIAHDLSVVKHMSDRVAVMYLGKFVELAPAEELYATPHHPYTVALMASIPGVKGSEALSAQSIEALGEMPSPLNPPTGCHFRTRCPRAQGLCAELEPPLRELEPNRLVACHFPVNSEVTLGPTARGGV